MTDTAPPDTLNPLRTLREAIRSLEGAGSAFWTMNLVFMLDNAAYFGILNILTLYLGDEIKLKDTVGHSFISVFLTGGLTLFAAIFGSMVDRLGVRRTILVTGGATLVGRVLLALASRFSSDGSGTSPAAIASAVSMVVMAFGTGVLTSAVYAGVKQVTTAKNSAVAFSVLYAVMNGGSAMASFVSPWVRERLHTGGVMWMCAAITAVYVGVHIVFFPKREGDPVPHTAKPNVFADIRAMANPRFLYFIFILLGVRTLFAHQYLTMPEYVTRAYSKAVSDRLEWIVDTMNPVIIFFGTPIVAALTKRAHVVTMMTVGTLVSALATFLLVPGPAFWALMSYEIIFSFGEALWSSRFYEYVATIAPPDKVGVYMGWASIPWFLAKTTTGLYSGQMLAHFCPEGGPLDTGTMWFVYALIGMSSPIGLLVAGRWLRGGNMDRSAPVAT